MLDRVVDLWGINDKGLIALEYRADVVDLDQIKFAHYCAPFVFDHPGFTIELLERYGIILSPEDGWYLCCTQGDGAPVAIDADQSLTPEQISFFYNLSEDFYQTINSILGDVDVLNTDSV